MYEEQFRRKAHMPLPGETTMDEYPTIFIHMACHEYQSGLRIFSNVLR